MGLLAVNASTSADVSAGVTPFLTTLSAQDVSNVAKSLVRGAVGLKPDRSINFIRPGSGDSSGPKGTITLSR
ncbi:hypothetical protein Areg01_39330 [Actinoplanes regularis]|nr:hypothetical protein Areg01_39330 [Actinoplanes regularis]